MGVLYEEIIIRYYDGYRFIDSLDNLVALAKANQGGANVYSYVFAYDYPVYGGLTATHGAELAFIFQSLNDNRAFVWK